MNYDQALRFPVCQRPQNHAIHNAEDGRIGADSKR